jgi:hypothetical protein
MALLQLSFIFLGNTAAQHEQFYSSSPFLFDSYERFHLGGKVLTSLPDLFKGNVRRDLTGVESGINR